MYIYIIFSISTSALILIHNIFKMKGLKFLSYFFLFGSFILNFFLMAFRINVGADYLNYIKFFDASPDFTIQGIFSYNIEPMFSIIVLLSKHIFNDFRYIFYISSFLTNIFIYLFILKFHPKKSQYIAFFFYNMIIYLYFLNLVRQGISIAIFLYSYYLSSKSDKRFWFFFFLSVSFHYSSFLFIGLIFIQRLGKFRKQIFLLTLPFVTTAVIFFLYYIIKFYFPVYFDNTLVSGYGFFVNRSLFLLFYIFIIIFKGSSRSGIEIEVLAVNFIGVFISLFTLLNANLWRIVLLFISADLIYLPYFNSNKKINKRTNLMIDNVIIFLSFLLVFIYHYVYFIISNTGEIFPYEFTL
jgi:hypothetical protein